MSEPKPAHSSTSPGWFLALVLAVVGGGGLASTLKFIKENTCGDANWVIESYLDDERETRFIVHESPQHGTFFTTYVKNLGPDPVAVRYKTVWGNEKSWREETLTKSNSVTVTGTAIKIDLAYPEIEYRLRGSSDPQTEVVVPGARTSRSRSATAACGQYSIIK